MVTGVLGCWGCRLPHPPSRPFLSRLTFAFPQKPLPATCERGRPGLARHPPTACLPAPQVPFQVAHVTPHPAEPLPGGLRSRLGAPFGPRGHHVVPLGRAVWLPLPRPTPPWGQSDAVLGMAYATILGTGWHRPEDSTAPHQGWGDMPLGATQPLGTGCHPRAIPRCQQQRCGRGGDTFGGVRGHPREQGQRLGSGMSNPCRSRPPRASAHAHTSHRGGGRSWVPCSGGPRPLSPRCPPAPGGAGQCRRAGPRGPWALALALGPGAARPRRPP